MQRNEHHEFVGVAGMKVAHAREIARFRRWEAHRDWQALHSAHYDWWMFPIDRASSRGHAYTVFSGDVAELVADPAYLRDYRDGVRILMLSWGWDVTAQQIISDPDPGQEWTGWAIRLLKCLDSTRLFGQRDLQTGVGEFARRLMDAGEPLRYGSEDLTGLISALILP